MAETVALTMGERDRLQVMSQLAERRLTRRRAAALLGLSERQIRRLYRAFRRDGAKALASRHRGRPSNRQLATATREQALTLVVNSHCQCATDSRAFSLKMRHQLPEDPSGFSATGSGAGGGSGDSVRGLPRMR